MTKLFISYPREETWFAQRLDTRLRLQGYETWIYFRDGDPDTDIYPAVKIADLHLVVVTQRSIKRSTGIHKEYHAASQLNKPIIPVMLFPVAELPEELQHIPPVDFQQDFDVAFDQLLQTIQANMPFSQPDTVQAGKDVLIAYYDLDAASGPQHAARTISEALTEQHVNTMVINYNGIPFDDTLKETIDHQEHIILILSRSTFAAFAIDGNAIKPSLEYMFAQDKNIIPVTISTKKGLGVRNPAFVGDLWNKLNSLPLLYVPPVYIPASDSRDMYVTPILERIETPQSPSTANAYRIARQIEKMLDAPKPEESAAALPLDSGLSHHIFLSYKRMDGETMRSVRDDLEAAGFVVWTDELIEKGTPQWQREIERAIRGTATLVCLLSPEAAQSDYVREELAAAKLFKKPIFLAMIRGTREECFIYGYMNSQMTDLRDPTHYDREFPLMVEAIKKQL